VSAIIRVLSGVGVPSSAMSGSPAAASTARLISS
jgi:hypothetical protein